MEIKLNILRKYRIGLLPSCTYRSVNNQSAGTNGDQAVAQKRKQDARLLVYCYQHLTQSISPSSASDMAESSPARPTAASSVCCSTYRASHRCSAEGSTSTQRPHSDRLPVFPSQPCGEALHLSEGVSIAAKRPLPHPINSFNTAH